MSVDPMTYEAQFFGFTPQTFMLRIYIAFQDYLFEVMQDVEQVILKKLDGIPDCEISPVQIRKYTEKFICFMKGRFDNLFGKMEQLFLQLILQIPPNVLLPEDKSQETHLQWGRIPLSPKEIEQLQKYKTELCTKQALLAELEKQKIVQAKLKQTLSLFDELEMLAETMGLVILGSGLVFLIQNSGKLRNIRKNVEKESKQLKISWFFNRKGSFLKRWTGAGFISRIFLILVNCIIWGWFLFMLSYISHPPVLVQSPEASMFYVELIFEASMLRGL